MKKRVLLVRHGHDPDDDRVVTFLTSRGFEPDIRKPFAGDLLGEVDDDLAGSVIYGGMYNAYDADKHPFLNEEYRWIGAALEAGLPLLGLCQGAQMIAYHQGAWAGARGDDPVHEFGCYEVRPAPEAGDFLTGPMHVTQAHFHTFDLPDGAVRLAGSDTYENQAFRLGETTYGFQFHPEQTIESFRRWQNSRTAAFDQRGAQSREEQNRLLAQHDEAQAAWFFDFLDKFLGTPERPA